MENYLLANADNDPVQDGSHLITNQMVFGVWVPMRTGLLVVCSSSRLSFLQTRKTRHH